jgi:hypothetical protein
MRRHWTLALGTVGALVVLAVIAAFLIDEPLRRSMEREVNDRLQGYTARIGRLDFHPIGFSLDLEDVTVVQDANPDPPVARLPRLSASVQWLALLRLRVVANFEFERPELHINRAHLVKEAQDEIPVEKRGWQHALAAIYPLKINEFTIIDGRLTYVDAEGDRALGRPLELSAVNVRAANIRNIMSPDNVYPSDVRVEATVFDRGRLLIDGKADFLAVPHPGIDATLALEEIDLSAFQGMLRRFNVALRKGVLAARGAVEYAPQVKSVRLEEVRLTGFDGDFVQTRDGAPKAKAAAKTAGRAAEQASNHPDLLLRIDRLVVRAGTFGFVNRKAEPDYRVFLSGADIDVTNLSNQRSEGTSSVKLVGKFMGSGPTVVTGTFRPELTGPDFELSLKIENTDMRSMNPLLRAHGKLDVAGGLFSFYSELAVKERHVRGYVKPLFSDLDVYDRRQDREKGAIRKLYERAVEGVSKLLENRPRDEVATQVDIAGPLENPEASTWQAVVNLLENAFIDAILPGFERQVSRLTDARR